MRDPKITHFPVSNGDCSLITLSDNTQILIDCNITEDSRDEDEESRYDVHAHLLKYGKKLNGKIPHVDAFILTHVDQDHCRGFETTFYTGDPASYADKHIRQGLLLIDELWFTPRIFSPHEDELCESAQAFRKEAIRRMDLHKARAAERAQ
jgi:glyoxylase-like metal-dependent hydrolase (beta-lactamase superfamily II)